MKVAKKRFSLIMTRIFTILVMLGCVQTEFYGLNHRDRIFLVSGEMVGTQSGLGYMIIDARNNLRPDILLATMIVIGGIGFVLDFLIGKFEKKVLTHYGVH